LEYGFQVATPLTQLHFSFLKEKLSRIWLKNFPMMEYEVPSAFCGGI